MTTNNMMTADQLGIPAEWHAAFVLVLARLETGRLEHFGHHDGSTIPDGDWFNMNWWNQTSGCGSVRCIGGWAEKLGEVTLIYDADINPKLESLLYPKLTNFLDSHCYSDITVTEAALALRSYLETGDAQWVRIILAERTRIAATVESNSVSDQ